MKFSFYGLLFICVFSFSFGLLSREDVTDNSTGITFPGTVSFQEEGKEYDLDITGVATRKRLIVKVYSIAHYLQRNAEQKHGKTIMEDIMSDEYAKQFTIKWARGVGVDKVKEAYQQAFVRVFPGQKQQQLSREISKFFTFFNHPAQKGDEYIIRWVPGGHVELIINGRAVGGITSVDFARGLWNVWFGEKSVVNRNDLISQFR